MHSVGSSRRPRPPERREHHRRPAVACSVGGHRILPTGGHQGLPTGGHSTAVSDRNRTLASAAYRHPRGQVIHEQIAGSVRCSRPRKRPPTRTISLSALMDGPVLAGESPHHPSAPERQIRALFSLPMGGPALARRALRHPSFLQLRLCVSANAFVRKFPHANCRPVERKSTDRRLRAASYRPLRINHDAG